MKLKKIIIINLIMLLILSGCSSRPEIAESENIPAVNIIEPEITTETPEEIYTEEAYTDEAGHIEEAAANEDINDPDSAIKDGFAFVYNNIIIYLGEYTDRVLAELKPALDYYEKESCSFDGIAKTYYYGSFEIETYLKSKDDNDRVYSVDLIDDSVATAEGIYIGQTYEDMTAAYGTEYHEIPEIPGFYSYEKNGTVLNFNIKDGAIISIKYKVADINA
jgi:hypothetical protein